MVAGGTGIRDFQRPGSSKTSDAWHCKNEVQWSVRPAAPLSMCTSVESVPNTSVAHPVWDCGRWGLSNVMATIRAWMPLMSLGSKDLASVRTEWEAIFFSLPHDHDNPQVPPDQKLVWKELPKHQFEGPTVTAADGIHLGVTSALENPSVNPIVGSGRTAAQVCLVVMVVVCVCAFFILCVLLYRWLESSSCLRLISEQTLAVTTRLSSRVTTS